MNDLPYNCKTPPFTETDHGHILTGNIHIAQNKKLRKLLCEGPNTGNQSQLTFKISKLK